MKSLLAALAAACTLSLTAQTAPAQQMLGDYYTMLGPVDLYNSRGQRLGDICAVLQQDRANFHRFGKREQYDGDDPWFGNRDARAVLGRNCRVLPGFEYIPREVLSGTPRYVWVRVYGNDGWPIFVEISEGAG